MAHGTAEVVVYLAAENGTGSIEVEYGTCGVELTLHGEVLVGGRDINAEWISPPDWDGYRNFRDSFATDRPLTERQIRLAHEMCDRALVRAARVLKRLAKKAGES